MSNRGSYQPQPQQKSKTNAFQHSTSSKVQRDLSGPTQGQNQHNTSWNSATNPQQYQQYSVQPYPPGVVNARQIPSEDVTKNNADATTDTYRQAKNTTTLRERDDQTKRFNLSTATQSGRDSSTNHEEKQDRLQYGSPGQEVLEKLREIPGDDGSVLKVSNATTSGHGWQQKVPTKLAVNNAITNTTYFEPSANVSRQSVTVTSRGDQNDLTEQSLLLVFWSY